MDPNANLQEQEAILTNWTIRADIARLRELRIALRDWLAAGGFEPTWTEYPIAARYYRGQRRYKLG